MSNNNVPASKLVLTPEKSALEAGRRNVLRVLVRIQAPDLPSGAPARDPLHLALVIDRSGSMSGEPLDQAKRCARHIVEQLGESDRVAVFAFDDEIDRMAPLTNCSNVHPLRAALDGIDSGGSTNLHGGWLAGAEELAAELQAEGVHRVILLSDGCANQGETDLERIATQCRDMARRGVTTSTYGLGRSFNEDLMLAMAKAGRGNAYYGETAGDLAEPFAAEFALLTNLCAHGLVLKVNVPDGVDVRMRNDYERVGDGALAWKLPDLAYAAEAWALLEFDIPAELCSGQELALAVTVSIEAAGQGSSPIFLMAPLSPLALADAVSHEKCVRDELVVRRALELEAADLLTLVRDAVSEGDWDRAKVLVTDAQSRFASHPWASSILNAMTSLIQRRDIERSRKEASFAAYSMRARLAERNEDLELDKLDVPAFLRRKDQQGKARR